MSAYEKNWITACLIVIILSVISLLSGCVYHSEYNEHGKVIHVGFPQLSEGEGKELNFIKVN